MVNFSVDASCCEHCLAEDIVVLTCQYIAIYRKYSENYLKMGFTSASDDDKEKPQCVLCYDVLSNEAIKV